MQGTSPPSLRDWADYMVTDTCHVMFYTQSIEPDPPSDLKDILHFGDGDGVSQGGKLFAQLIAGCDAKSSCIGVTSKKPMLTGAPTPVDLNEWVDLPGDVLQTNVRKRLSFRCSRQPT
jgi:hypothetical protein